MRALIVIIISLLLFQCCTEKVDTRTPEEIGRSVVDRVIKETTFDFEYVLQEPVIDLQVIDYKNEYHEAKGVFYSLASLNVKEAAAIRFGLNFSGTVKIFCNDKEVFRGTDNRKAEIKEIAYNLFEFNHHFMVNVKEGDNKILIKMVTGSKRPVIILREVTEEHEAPLKGKFNNYFANLEIGKVWMHCGPFRTFGDIPNTIDKIYPPEKEIRNFYDGNKEYNWSSSKDRILKKLVIKDSNTYKRESTLEWHYANGNTFLGLLSLADKLKENDYYKFVQDACDFTIDNFSYFKCQYDKLYAIRGTNNKIFRSTMLDDTGAPALPYLQIYLNNSDEKFGAFLEDITNYVVDEQVRLSDGTFCRPEPHKMTVWADDLFMSVPYLLRLAKNTNNAEYYDDVANQVVNFYGYLFDESVGICKHAWFDFSKKKSEVYWGRANGWMIWATSEALLYLPKEHKLYDRIHKQFADHIRGLVSYQGESGMWHQVLDHRESFEETSCTAMYIIALARGITNNWIDEKYETNLMHAWNALKRNISGDGVVKDICRGTGIGYDLEFYFNRKRFDNDPRGLGAVLTASSEMIDFVN